MNLVYFSPVPWRSFSQRPHKFVQWCHARHDARVLWIEPYPTRFPAWHDLRRLVPGRDRVEPEARHHASSWLTIVKPSALPLEPIAGIGGLNSLLWTGVFERVSEFLSEGRGMIAVGKPSQLASRVLQRHRGVPSLFDAMDDYAAFYQGTARKAMERRTNEIASLVSRISISSQAMMLRFEAHRYKTLLVRNACDTDALPSIEATRGDGADPILGYVGTIGRWFDWSLVRSLADVGAPARIRLIGPLRARPPRALPGNVEVLPALGHGTAMAAMREFAVGLIPFRRTDLTQSVDPIKYYEYRACGLPIISSPFGEMVARDREPGVFLVEEGASLDARVRSALDYRYDRDAVRAFRHSNSWTARFDASRILAA